jgi:lipopolysaccharide/colanic/teichoic acid biosynthesis glycosyltransferase
VVVIHEPNPLALLSYWLVRPPGPLVIWFHSQVLPHRWFYRFYGPLLRWGLRRADAIVVSSPRLIAHAPELAPHRDKCAVVPFGVAPEEFVLTPALQTAARRARERYGTPLLLFVGRLVPYKGVDVFLRALCRLDASAVIVGSGPLEPTLRRLAHSLGIGEQVHFVGELPDDELRALYHACDAFVLPSVAPNEAFGVVQLEAMACAKPVVSTDLPTGVPWVNRDGETGLVVPPRDPRALRAALARLLDDPLLREKLGRQGWRRVHDEFTVERMVDRFTELAVRLGQLAKPHRSPLAKRALDCTLSGIGLLLSAPLWAAIALLIKLDDGGPVFYGQLRVGRGGRPFKGWKFRSMTPDADRRFGPRQAGAEDERVTRVGRVLRATAMDELPQLWNIFRGDMSFVGPRALMPQEIEVGGGGEPVALADIPGYHERHRVTPGLTGIAQIYADRDITRRDKFRYDRLYIRKRTFWLDVRLIALSFWITARGKWEHRGTKF